ncbi:hypothetical protein WG622_17305 [Cognatishimia sp. D5M38]|uniref:Prepilin type IV endopeptidase peptidase domain-containing protein n=1 Tax=Cognatishimia coralii TaxID=3083254 RepID=A0ABU8QKS7_9RHOB|nr:hypothetical protein [Donghicola eburneus]MCI5040950.1 hypothetical protein [Donghicola eburneus]
MIWDPSYLSLFLLPIGALGVSVGLISLSWYDVTRFEIDPPSLLLVVLGAAATFLALGQDFTAPLSAGVVLLTLSLGLRICSPKSIGEGDLWLFAGLGFVSGPLVGVFVSTLFVACLITAFAYSRARGKPALKSSFPMALPACIAASIAFAIQLLGVVV